MIRFTTGNLFDCGADCLINTVNCEGYMGKGVAYQFKLKFPENNKSYIKACRSGELTVGKLHHYTENGITIINFPTKDKWRKPSKIEYIENGMNSLVQLIPHLNVHKIAIPPLGCGNGGLNWNDVKKIITNKLLPIENNYEFIIFEPSSVSYKQVPAKASKISLSGLVLLDIRMNLERFNALRLQKTGYFVNLFMGEEYFKFDKWKYGPYSHAISLVARNIKEYQTHYGIDNSKDTFDHVYREICSDKVSRKFGQIHVATLKAAHYVNQISSDKHLEGVSTVLYLVQTGVPKNHEEIIHEFKAWSDDKSNRFSREDISNCISYLEDTGIISLDMYGKYQLTSKMLK